jgi:hypothetical protein
VQNLHTQSLFEFKIQAWTRSYMQIKCQIQWDSLANWFIPQLKSKFPKPKTLDKLFAMQFCIVLCMYRMLVYPTCPPWHNETSWMCDSISTWNQTENPIQKWLKCFLLGLFSSSGHSNFLKWTDSGDNPNDAPLAELKDFYMLSLNQKRGEDYFFHCSFVSCRDLQRPSTPTHLVSPRSASAALQTFGAPWPVKHGNSKQSRGLRVEGWGLRV